jgi:hypothetical protein
MRLEKIEKIYKKQLKNTGMKDTFTFFKNIVDADVTKGKYVRFLIEAFLNNKFLEEDLIGGLESTIGQAICLFHKHKSKLPENMRSIYNYTSPGDLWNNVKQFQGELSGKELKKEEREKIYRETKFIYKDEDTGFQIVSPLTEESAKWWGKGTRWCTSAENNNMFYSYVKDAPLFILLMPASASTAGNGDKLQLWKNQDDIQFMNEADNKVTLDYIKENWKILEPICRWLNNIRFIPKQYRTKELYEIAIKQDGLNLMYVPEQLRTKELCELAIQNNGEALYYVPDEFKTKELCELAVRNNGMALGDIPEQYRTKELCELAIRQDGYALKYILDEFKTEELYKLAIKNNGLALQYVPEYLKTEELYKSLVQHDGHALRFFPRELKTIELCEIAIKQSGCLCHVPYKYRTKELCELAVKQNGFALDYVPKELITPELCELAVKQNENALFCVPEQFKNGLQHYVKNEILKLEIPIDKYQETFQEIKTFFPMKDVSLEYYNA